MNSYLIRSRRFVWTLRTMNCLLSTLSSSVPKNEKKDDGSTQLMSLLAGQRQQQQHQKVEVKEEIDLKRRTTYSIFDLIEKHSNTLGLSRIREGYDEPDEQCEELMFEKERRRINFHQACEKLQQHLIFQNPFDFFFF
jgi:hypothetical protein